MHSTRYRLGEAGRALLWVAGVALGACSAGGDAPGEHVEPPVQVANPQPEEELARVTLSDAAVARLGLETAEVVPFDARGRRVAAGELITPPGRVVTVAAPVAGRVRASAPATAGASVARGELIARLVPLAPVDRDVRARAARELAAAEANLGAAQARVERTQALAAGRAGSQRAIEEAVAARDVAQADVDVASSRVGAIRAAPLAVDVALPIRAPVGGVLRSVSYAPGQVVPAGAPLLEIVAEDELWVRVPVASADLDRVDSHASASVESLASGARAAPVEAVPIAGPPTATPAASTVDRYFALAEGAERFAPGARVLVWLPLRLPAESAAAAGAHTMAVPYAAVFYDAGGAAWVYVCEDGRSFHRARVDVLRRDGSQAVLTRGPAEGTCVVSAGVSDLYGSEFEPRH